MSAPERPEIESVVLCEGYHDRAFWKGWLEHLGCQDARPRRDGRYITAKDPFGRPVGSGHFAFYTPSDAFVRVRPCEGDGGVLEQLERRLEDRRTRALQRLIVSLDNDAEDNGDSKSRASSLRQSIKHRVTAGASGCDELENGDLALLGEVTVVSLVLWSAEEPPLAHLPGKQTLERLVCAALCAVHPARGAAVAAWLASRPSPPPASPKEHAWSHMAGWYGAQGCDEFYQALWREPAVAAELRRRLEASGSWHAAEALLAP